MKINKKIIVQGFPGCFHEEAACKYFNTNDLEIVPAATFPILASTLVSNPKDHLAIIAIENSIAGSILQNYRILRENHLRIIGEVYLRIKHNLMVMPGQKIEDIKEVYSHPMAIKQCLDYFIPHNSIKLIESEDTALSALRIRKNETTGIAAIASKRAADIYQLEIIGEGIESSKVNYTRFFILQDSTQELPKEDFNKASIYLRVSHEKGSLMRILEQIYNHNVNLSKLQSYPVLGEINSYYFHLDLEFDDIENYQNLINILHEQTMLLEVLGVYKQASIYDMVL